HGLGGGGEEVPAAVPVPGLLPARQPQVRLVHQRGRLQGLAGLFVGQFLGRELAQLVVDQRQELLRGRGVALLDGAQDTRDVAHEHKGNRRGGGRPASERESTGGGRVANLADEGGLRRGATQADSCPARARRRTRGTSTRCSPRAIGLSCVAGSVYLAP